MGQVINFQTKLVQEEKTSFIDHVTFNESSIALRAESLDIIAVFKEMNQRFMSSPTLRLRYPENWDSMEQEGRATFFPNADTINTCSWRIKVVIENGLAFIYINGMR